MRVKKIESMTKGWFIGDFEPAAFKTQDFEVSWRIHPKGEHWETHYHKEATEINLLIKGSMTIQNQHLTSGDIFILDPEEIADPVFLEDCEVLCIKTPSVPDDKYIVK